MSVRIVKSNVHHPDSIAPGSADGSIIYDNATRCYFFKWYLGEGNVDDSVGLIDQEWARDIDAAELDHLNHYFHNPE